MKIFYVAIFNVFLSTSSGFFPKIKIMASFPKSPVWNMISGGAFQLSIAFLMPHDMVLPSLSLFFGGSVFLSYDEIFRPFEIARFIVILSYFKFKLDLMLGNFLAISNTADATCFDPPYLRFPATVTRFPVLTILPSNPITSFRDSGFDVEYTKFVWHSGMCL